MYQAAVLSKVLANFEHLFHGKIKGLRKIEEKTLAENLVNHTESSKAVRLVEAHKAVEKHQKHEKVLQNEGVTETGGFEILEKETRESRTNSGVMTAILFCDRKLGFFISSFNKDLYELLH